MYKIILNYDFPQECYLFHTLNTQKTRRLSHGVFLFRTQNSQIYAEDALLGSRLPPVCFFFSPPPHQDSLGKINLPPSQPMLSYRIGLTRISRISQKMHSFARIGLRNHNDYLSTEDTEDTVLLSRSAYQTLNSKLSTNILTLNTQTYAENALLGSRLPPVCFFSPPPHQDSLGKINLPPSQPMLSYRIGLTRISRISQILQVAALLLGLRALN